MEDTPITFKDLKLNTPLYNALDDLGFEHPTPIKKKAFKWLPLVKMW